MAKIRNVPRDAWTTFFDTMSQSLLGKSAEVESASLDFGDQIVAEWIPLLGITYDWRDDLLDIALDRTNRLIRRPREVAVEETEAGVTTVAVVDSDGARHIVRLKTPLALTQSSARV